MIKLTECLKSHAENELKLAGYNIVDPVDNVQSDDDYDNAIAQNVYDMIKVFSNGGHSGFSAEAALNLFNKLARGENLTPLGVDENEWEDVSDISKYPLWQNRRNSKVFSNDSGKTWWKLSEAAIKKAKKKLKIKSKKSSDGLRKSVAIDGKY